MTETPHPGTLLRLAIVLRTSEDVCTVFVQDHQAELPYAVPFPKPHVERVAPGHLVAIASASDGTDVVAWRWYDAVVLSAAAGQVTLWEPTHGEVLATARDPQRAYRPGSRAYLSAGLPGAEWWVAGPSVNRGEDADVDLVELELFFTDHGVWDVLT